MEAFTEHYYKIIYEDGDLVAVSKQHGVHVITDRYKKVKFTLKDILAEKYPKIFVVHRLDAGTGGVIVFAKNEEAHKKLSEQFERREVEKEYIAITINQIANQTLMLPIAKANHGKFKINFKSGKNAVTSFMMIATNVKNSIIMAKPKTGRTHQIRIHLKALKAPLAVDKLYNQDIDDNRLTLFASKLKFKHPKTDELIEISAPMSEFMLDVAEKLELSLENVYQNKL